MTINYLLNNEELTEFMKEHRIGGQLRGKTIENIQVNPDSKPHPDTRQVTSGKPPAHPDTGEEVHLVIVTVT